MEDPRRTNQRVRENRDTPGTTIDIPFNEIEGVIETASPEELDVIMDIIVGRVLDLFESYQFETGSKNDMTVRKVIDYVTNEFGRDLERKNSNMISLLLIFIKYNLLHLDRGSDYEMPPVLQDTLAIDSEAFTGANVYETGEFPGFNFYTVEIDDVLYEIGRADKTKLFQILVPFMKRVKTLFVDHKFDRNTPEYNMAIRVVDYVDDNFNTPEARTGFTLAVLGLFRFSDS